MKFYKVTCLRGHMGTNYLNCYITFYYKCDNAIIAMKRAQKQPGVKHSRLPISCIEITYEEFLKNRKVSAYVRFGN